MRFLCIVAAILSAGCSAIKKIPREYQAETTGYTTGIVRGRHSSIVGRSFEFHANGRSYTSTLFDDNAQEGESYRVVYDRRNPYVSNILYATKVLPQDQPALSTKGTVVLVYPKGQGFAPFIFYEYKYDCSNSDRADSCTNTKNHYIADDYEKLYPNLKPGNQYEVTYLRDNPKTAVLNIHKPLLELSHEASQQFLKQRRRKYGIYMVEVLAGYNYAKDVAFTNWARHTAGVPLKSPYNTYDYFGLNFGGMVRRVYFDLGVNFMGARYKTCTQANTSAGFAISDNPNLIVIAKVNAGFQQLAIKDDKPPASPYQYFYQLDEMYAGPALKVMMFPKTKTRQFFIGLEGGLNYICSNNSWKHGYTDGSGKYAKSYYSKVSGVPAPANSFLFFRLSIGFANDPRN